MNPRPIDRRQLSSLPCAQAPGHVLLTPPAARFGRSGTGVFALLMALAGSIPATIAAAPAAPAAPTVAATAAAADPSAMLQGAVDEVLAIAYDDKPGTDPLPVRVRPVLTKYFSFDALTRSAVGPTWRDFTPAQQARTTELFTELVVRTYAQKFEPGDRPKVSYAKAVEIDATRRELPTTITYAGKNYAVSYRVRQMADSWRIYDVNIEGISLVANYRAQFDALAQKGGAAAIIAALEKNIADFSAKK